MIEFMKKYVMNSNFGFGLDFFVFSLRYFIVLKLNIERNQRVLGYGF